MNDKVHLLLIDDEKNYLLVLETLLTDCLLYTSRNPRLGCGPRA